MFQNGRHASVWRKTSSASRRFLPQPTRIASSLPTSSLTSTPPPLPTPPTPSTPGNPADPSVVFTPPLGRYPDNPRRIRYVPAKDLHPEAPDYLRRFPPFCSHFFGNIPRARAWNVIDWVGVRRQDVWYTSDREISWLQWPQDAEPDSPPASPDRISVCEPSSVWEPSSLFEEYVGTDEGKQIMASQPVVEMDGFEDFR
jgi:hypothetical protein